MKSQFPVLPENRIARGQASAKTWKRSTKVIDYEKSSGDNFTRSSLQRFEPESSLGKAADKLRNSSFSSFHKAAGLGACALFTGIGSVAAGIMGSPGIAAALGVAGVCATVATVKTLLDTGQDYVGYRKLDKATGGVFRGDKQSAEAFGFAGAIIGGAVASYLSVPLFLGMVPGAILFGALGYNYVGELLKDLSKK